MIKTQDCKQAICDYVTSHPGHVKSQFCDVTDPDFEVPAARISNWKRISKEKLDHNMVRREFDCKPYDDQLRAITIDDGNIIVSVVVQGE